jgi:hypothetical protein
LKEIIKFLKTGTPPVTSEETLEIYAFMEAADESKHRNQTSVKLDEIWIPAHQTAHKKLKVLI